MLCIVSPPKASRNVFHDTATAPARAGWSATPPGHQPRTSCSTSSGKEYLESGRRAIFPTPRSYQLRRDQNIVYSLIYLSLFCSVFFLINFFFFCTISSEEDINACPHNSGELSVNTMSLHSVWRWLNFTSSHVFPVNKGSSKMCKTYSEMSLPPRKKIKKNKLRFRWRWRLFDIDDFALRTGSS